MCLWSYLQQERFVAALSECVCVCLEVKQAYYYLVNMHIHKYTKQQT